MMTGLKVVVTTEGEAPIGAVVREVSGDPGTGRGGGVTSFLVVVTSLSGVKIPHIIV